MNSRRAALALGVGTVVVGLGVLGGLILYMQADKNTPTWAIILGCFVSVFLVVNGIVATVRSRARR